MLMLTRNGSSCSSSTKTNNKRWSILSINKYMLEVYFLLYTYVRTSHPRNSIYNVLVSKQFLSRDSDLLTLLLTIPSTAAVRLVQFFTFHGKYRVTIFHVMQKTVPIALPY